ncbi:DUF4142 domain-containing protein [Roseicella frigidaeris]|uniref:DUF4142 domain-containing protein n=1 Tax=Roseicella frigidaeris TaxID=2230885 RepID=A0A327LYX3_9PROT|nr:DUF4142 domain-containing protein [Roseicella frigidaeris]RAI55185.1 hypothetical protein DOO78_24885 [Roseicella frigidaeris]
MLRRTTLLLAGAAALAGGAAGAQTRITPDPTPRLPSQPGQGMPIEDLRVLQRAALFSDAQAEAGQLGAERAASPQVRQLAEAIAADHGRFRQGLAAVAAERKLELPNRAAARIQDPSLDALRQTSGEAFDRAFLARQLGLYRPMAELFQTMASNSPDPALQRLGITALSSVRTHFETARKLGEPMELRAETVENPPQY